MVIVRPFNGVRPRKDLYEKIASPPYDVLDSEEAREMVKNNQISFLRVIKPEVDLDPNVDLYSEPVYQKGKENLHNLISEGQMVKDDKPMFYFYRQVMGDHSQYGLVATVSATDYENDLIKKHEFTRPDKEADRVKHIITQNAQCGPVFLTYNDVGEVTAAQESVCGNAPDADFTSEDGIRHTLWGVSDEALVSKIKNTFEAVPAIYVADGHHRSAAGTIVAQKKREENPGFSGDEEFNYFLAVLFPKSQMKILAYNRVVQGLNGLEKDAFLEAVGQKFNITEGANPLPYAVHAYAMYLDGTWYGITPKDGSFPADDPVKSLDASILQENLLDPVLGIDDPRTNKRIKFVGGIRGTQELEKLCNEGKFTVAFSLYPTTIDQLMSVADSGNVMPPKSTWFEPKLRSGMVIHMLD